MSRISDPRGNGYWLSSSEYAVRDFSYFLSYLPEVFINIVIYRKPHAEKKNTHTHTISLLYVCYNILIMLLDKKKMSGFALKRDAVPD